MHLIWRIPLILILALSFIMVSILAYLIAFLPLSQNAYHTVYKIWSAAFLKVFMVKKNLHYYHTHPLPENFIMVSNHPSGIDTILVPSSFHVTALSKDDIRTWPLLGRIIRTAGIIFVKRDSHGSRNASVIASMQAIKQNKNLLIFPEGGCFGKGINPFKSGAFDISLKTGVPILPVFIYYEKEDIYEWGDVKTIDYVLRLLFIPKNRRVHLFIFDAFDPSLFTKTTEFKEKVYNFYKEQYNRLHLPNE